LPYQAKVNRSFPSTLFLTESAIVDAHIHNLPLEAGWAAKYAGLSKKAALDLVSRNIEKILGLEVTEETRDVVIWEGNPMEFGSNVVLSYDGKTGSVGTCWPDST
jgi:imidazolonepropionase-like amidohydrolase